MAEAVLDASAVLALLADEPGAEPVREVLGSALVSAVNLAEVLAKLTDLGLPESEQRRIMASLDVEVRDFGEDAAWTSAALRPVSRALGLSTGDRACLALALRESLPVLTSDRAWSKLDLDVDVRVIR